MTFRDRLRSRSEARRPFLDLVLAGQEKWDAIDTWVDRWHDSKTDLALHEFLGMTPSECNVWAADARNIVGILYSRHHHIPLEKGIFYVRQMQLLEPDVQKFLQKEGIIPE